MGVKGDGWGSSGRLPGGRDLGDGPTVGSWWFCFFITHYLPLVVKIQGIWGFAIRCITGRTVIEFHEYYWQLWDDPGKDCPVT